MKPFRASIELEIDASDIGEANALLREAVEYLFEEPSTLTVDAELVTTAVGESPQLEQSHNDTPCGAERGA